MEKYSLQTLNLAQIHLVGIGGAGQSALADILLDMGYSVSGSDLKLSATTAALQARGVTIYAGHSAANLNNSTLVVTTAAAQSDNVELAEAKRRGLPVLQNAEMTGLLLNTKANLLAVAGTHGKTTTSGLVAFLLERLNLAPTWYVGGVVASLGKAGRAQSGDFAVVEADEFAGRFLHYRPSHALITNIEADHLDYYGTMDALRQAFYDFAANVPELYLCADDPEARALAKRLAHHPNVFLYGLSEAANWQATEIQPNAKGGYSFVPTWNGQALGRVELNLAGLHNVRNALGAIALVFSAAGRNRALAAQICQAAGEYTGAARRFELKGEAHGVTVIDDYAHHPTEIRATLQAARARFGTRRLVALFQPHTYTRTKALLEEFAAAFGEADVVGILEIFPARETDTLGVSSADILRRMQHPGKLAEPLTLENAAATLRNLVQPGDVLLTLGAGDIWQVGESFLKA